jgi:hypothetical protein
LSGEKKEMEDYDRSNNVVPTHGQQEQEKKKKNFLFFSRSLEDTSIGKKIEEREQKTRD